MLSKVVMGGSSLKYGCSKACRQDQLKIALNYHIFPIGWFKVTCLAVILFRVLY